MSTVTYTALTNLRVPTKYHSQISDPDTCARIEERKQILTNDPTSCPPIRVFPLTYRIVKNWEWYEAAWELGWEEIPVLVVGDSPRRLSPRRRGHPINPLIPYLLQRRQQTTCAYCGKNLFTTCPASMPYDAWAKRHRPTLDHRIPKSRGGSSQLTNLAVACRACNQAKADKLDWHPPISLIFETLEVNKRWPIKSSLPVT